MEIKVIKNEKNRAVIEVKGIGHAFCNMLKKELYSNPHVNIVSYRIQHPLINTPQIIVETDGKDTPKDAFLNACKKLKKVSDNLKKEMAREIK
jgi:DNA-directed RNA polymerase subunit L